MLLPLFTLALVPRKPTTFATVERGGKTKLVFALPGMVLLLISTPNDSVVTHPASLSLSRQPSLLHCHVLPLCASCSEKDGWVEETTVHHHLS